MPQRFTKRKFLNFSHEKQHKKSAEVLREIYNEMQEWMGKTPLQSFCSEQISNRYHNHLTLSCTNLTEPHLLPKVKKHDKQHPSHAPLPIMIYLDHIRSAHNVGSILRTVEAFCLGEVIFSSDTPFINHPQVQKTSMGAYQMVKCSQEKNFIRPLIALETCKGSIPLHEFVFPETFTLAVGNEEYGCSEAILLEADVILEIPLGGKKNSLNVANAFAIAAAEISKQKHVRIPDGNNL